MTQELTLDNTDPLDGGDYQCAITNTAGNTSAMITLNGEILHTKISITVWRECLTARKFVKFGKSSMIRQTKTIKFYL